MKTIKNSDVSKVFDQYPKEIQEKMYFLRRIVLEVAAELEGNNTIEETLKWGEPSYIMKGGSTIRMDWKRSSPLQYALYFHCKTKLVDTFKELYRDELKFETNRAIIFNVNDKLPIEILRHCILLALTYHSRKNLPLLGA